jgi:WD40 repeat protein
LSHENEVTMAEFSPDGLSLVSASLDQTAKVWDAHTGTLLAMPLVHRGGVVHASFSPRGDRIATASRDYQVNLWDVRLGRPENLWFKHDSNVLAVGFRSDGSTALTATSRGTVSLWNLTTGARLEPTMSHPAAVNFAQFLPDNQRLLTAAADGRLRVWQADEGRLLAESPSLNGRILTVHWNDAGNRVVASAYPTNVVIWRPAEKVTELYILPHSNSVISARLSPDGRFVVTADSDGIARVWDATTRRLLSDRLFSRDYSLTMSRDMLLNFYRASKQDDAPAQTATQAEPADSSGVAFPSWFYDFPESRVWQGMPLTNVALTNSEMRNYLKHVAWRVASVATLWAEYSPDGKRIATASMDGTGRLWEAETGKELTPALTHLGPVHHIEFNRAGTRVATASADHTARIWDATNRRPVTGSLAHNEPVESAHFSPDGRKLVTVTSGGSLQVWDVVTGLPLMDPWAYGCAINEVAFSPDSQHLITGSEDGYARLWELASPPNPVTSPLLSLAEALAGVKNLADNAEPLTLDHLFNVAQQHRRIRSSDFYSLFSRWILAAGPASRIPLGSTITADAYLARLLANDDRRSLEQAVRVCPTNALAVARFAGEIMKQEAQADPRSRAESRMLMQRARALAPTDPDVERLARQFQSP